MALSRIVTRPPTFVRIIPPRRAASESSPLWSFRGSTNFTRFIVCRNGTGAGSGRELRAGDKVKRNAFRQNRTEHSPPPGKSDLFEPGIPTLRSRLAQPLFKVTASLSLPFSLPLKVFYLSESSFVAVSRNRSGFLWRWRRTDRRTVHVRPTVRSSGGLPACLPE